VLLLTSAAVGEISSSSSKDAHIAALVNVEATTYNKLQHEDLLRKRLQEALRKRGKPFTDKHGHIITENEIVRAAHNVFGKGEMRAFTTEAEAQVATKVKGTSYYKDIHDQYQEYYPVSLDAENLAIRAVTNAKGEYAALARDNRGEHVNRLIKNAGADFIAAGGGGAIAGVGAIGAGMGAIKGISSKSVSGAANIASMAKLRQQLIQESARSPFTADGKLTKECIQNARPILGLEPGKLKNLDIPKEFGKYTTETYHSPTGDFQVHFYKNPSSGEVLYDLDYKAVFNKMSGVPKK
jgi:hypothetical protein